MQELSLPQVPLFPGSYSTLTQPKSTYIIENETTVPGHDPEVIVSCNSVSVLGDEWLKYLSLCFVLFDGELYGLCSLCIKIILAKDLSAVSCKGRSVPATINQWCFAVVVVVAAAVFVTIFKYFASEGLLPYHRHLLFAFHQSASHPAIHP